MVISGGGVAGIDLRRLFCNARGCDSMNFLGGDELDVRFLYFYMDGDSLSSARGIVLVRLSLDIYRVEPKYYSGRARSITERCGGFFICGRGRIFTLVHRISRLLEEVVDKYACSGLMITSFDNRVLLELSCVSSVGGYRSERGGFIRIGGVGKRVFINRECGMNLGFVVLVKGRSIQAPGAIGEPADRHLENLVWGGAASRGLGKGMILNCRSRGLLEDCSVMGRLVSVFGSRRPILRCLVGEREGENCTTAALFDCESLREHENIWGRATRRRCLLLYELEGGAMEGDIE
ncbi:hypothetical protein Tco_0064912 [Tanacetum coccineum]